MSGDARCGRSWHAVRMWTHLVTQRVPGVILRRRSRRYFAARRGRLRPAGVVSLFRCRPAAACSTTRSHGDAQREALSAFLQQLVGRWPAPQPLGAHLGGVRQLHDQNMELSISLLDQRFLTGDQALYDELAERLPQFFRRQRDSLVRNLASLRATPREIPLHVLSPGAEHQGDSGRLSRSASVRLAGKLRGEDSMPEPIAQQARVSFRVRCKLALQGRARCERPHLRPAGGDSRRIQRSRMDARVFPPCARYLSLRRGSAGGERERLVERSLPTVSRLALAAVQCRFHALSRERVILPRHRSSCERSRRWCCACSNSLRGTACRCRSKPSGGSRSRLYSAGVLRSSRHLCGPL